VLAQLSALSDAQAPVAALGKAAYAGTLLATVLGQDEVARQLGALRAQAARIVIAGAPTVLAEAVRGCRWVRAEASPELQPGQALDLEQLVRAMGERGNLRALLNQVLDVMLLWTCAERGLLLLRERDGQLEPRAARNLRRADLTGEQLDVSRSLAERALEAGEPVVAIDAMQELGSSYQSVHALKLRSVLALPLFARGELLGVVYLDDRVRRGAFGTKEVAWAQAVAPIAAMAISDAATQAQLRQAVRRAERASQRLEQSLAERETALDLAERELAQAVGDRTTRFAYDEIIGQSEPVQTMLRMLDRLSLSDVPVLLRGESGSGKELVARAIHHHSSRASRPFVGENCAALPDTLLESALFGHVRGAFTGAMRSRVGLLEAADGGTLFLDEIGEMSPGMQTKLLRVLEDGEVRPLGSERAQHVDVRIMAATHRDLERMVSQGGFREDLYYRLNVVTVPIPPLRERPSDVPLLVQHLIDKHAGERKIRVTPRAMGALGRCSWPGNVRQLENEVRRALLLCDGVIDLEHLSIPTHESAPAAAVGLEVRARVDQLEADLVRQALERTGGNQTHAAKLLGISRYGLHKMMKRLGFTSDAGRG
jgi:transcriptional regulator with GAF, ATPase, and Fis domain